MAESTYDATDVQRGFEAILSGLAPLAKDALQRGLYRLQPYIVRYMDKAGPPKGVRSTSPRIALRTGDTARSLTPNAPANLFDPALVPNAISVEFGIDTEKLLYPLFHEFANDFNVPFPERPFFYPGVQDWEAKELLGIESSIEAAITKLWNQT